MHCWISLLLLAVLSLASIVCQHADTERVQGPPGQPIPGPKQERSNRLVPDFQPFQHPASKVRLFYSNIVTKILKPVGLSS